MPSTAQMFGVVNIFVHDQSNEFGVGKVIIQRVFDVGAQRFKRRHFLEMPVCLGFADAAIGLLQHGAIKLFLAAKVIIDHPLGTAGLFGDFVNARAGQPLGGKFGGGHAQNISARGICVMQAAILGCSVGHTGAPFVQVYPWLAASNRRAQEPVHLRSVSISA